VSGIDPEGSFSHDGKFVVYTDPSSQDSKASVLIVRVNGLFVAFQWVCHR
jgi:Tol biopolymer transport system component